MIYQGGYFSSVNSTKTERVHTNSVFVDFTDHSRYTIIKYPALKGSTFRPWTPQKATVAITEVASLALALTLGLKEIIILNP